MNGKRLARNSVYNLLGQGGPLVIAVISVPLLIHGIGTARFGILTLAWSAVGYFSLFDLGLARTLTQTISAALGGSRDDDLPGIAWTALGAMSVLGVIAGVTLFACTDLLVQRLLNISPALQPEAIASFHLLALSMPFVLATDGFRGLLEAHQEFGISTALRVPYSAFNYIAPLAVLPFSHSLVPIVALLLIGRVSGCLAYVFVCIRRYPFLRRRAVVRRSAIAPLARVGGWMAVSSIISPLMVNIDRFLIGSLLTMTAVAYYATPYDVVTKLLLIPGAILGVLFPAFAESFARDRALTAVLIERAVRAMLLMMFPLVVLCVSFAREGLLVWVGPDFAAHSAIVVRWLAIGAFINSVGQVPFSALQGIGRPDLTARLHVLELPLYALAIWFLAARFGLAGVAAAWTLRICFDTAVLLWLSGRALPEARAALRPALQFFLVLLLLLVGAAEIDALQVRAVFAAAVLIGFVALAWRRLLQPGERALIRSKVTSFGFASSD